MTFKQRSVGVHDFSMVPSPDVPRSSFHIQKRYMTTFDSGFLVPFFVEEVLPGDTFNVKGTIFARLATPLFPYMDNLHLETFFFYVPNRIVWTNWVKFMGEQDNPADSISFTIPQTVSPVAGWTIGSIADFMGLPTVGQVGGAVSVSHSCLPMRAYSLIYNKFFRDENLQNGYAVSLGDGPDAAATWGNPARRGKRFDYFTQALPFVQKGTAVALPLGTTAPVMVIPSIATGNSVRLNVQGTTTARQVVSQAAGTGTTWGALSAAGQPVEVIADLSAATAATINQIRTAFQIQKLLERDARGGTRYQEILFSHFKVNTGDARLQRPEYLGGGRGEISVIEVEQQSASAVTGSTTPMGTLAAKAMSVSHNHGFHASFPEHGYVIGIVNVFADLTYQQGMRRHWSRNSRYDYYFPVFSHLGEQAILNKEIYCDGSANDALVFGYVPRWDEYRYMPSEITGLFRSTAAGTLDAWHLAQKFTGLPTLNATFIQETPPLQRVLAVAAQTGKELLCDMFFDIKAARPLPKFSVPGWVDHF